MGVTKIQTRLSHFHFTEFLEDPMQCTQISGVVGSFGLQSQASSLCPRPWLPRVRPLLRLPPGTPSLSPAWNDPCSSSGPLSYCCYLAVLSPSDTVRPSVPVTEPKTLLSPLLPQSLSPVKQGCPAGVQPTTYTLQGLTDGLMTAHRRV